MSYIWVSVVVARTAILLSVVPQGRVFVTGSPGDETLGYFRLHFNQYNSVETITCISKQVSKND